jgi:DNA/RNA-binding domain of Phe-tRNA-synthetase-like protein
MLTLTETWTETYPAAHAGILVMRNVTNPEDAPALDNRKRELEGALRSRFAGMGRAAIKALPVVQAYNAYYKGFRKTYHVRHQLESVALKGRDIPRAAALVEAMFMAELEHLLLTAGHDLDVVAPPVTLGAADGSERYTRINGKEQTLKAGDMFIADAEGVLSSIIYGPDRRTMIRPTTRNVLFTVYAPAGIAEAATREHLIAIRDNVRLVAPESEVAELDVYGA